MKKIIGRSLLVLVFVGWYIFGVSMFGWTIPTVTYAIAGCVILGAHWA